MDSFEGSRRQDPRSPLSGAERRATRDGEPLEQRLDRWMSTGRQLVEGVSGGRPGSRPSGRRPEGRAGSRGGSGSLGRWVENRLDWLLDDSDDWPEPWQESARRRSEGSSAMERRLMPEREPLTRDSPARSARQEAMRTAGDLRPGTRPGPLPDDRPRRRLEAVSRRGVSGRAASAAAPGPTPQAAETEAWPDDSSFSVPRWQRPTAPLRRPDPLQTELDQPDPKRGNGGETAPAGSPRPLPRSSRRR